MRIGIYSGSFDPVHIGHTNLARWIAANTYLDSVWLMVSPENPLKNGYIATEEERLVMARIACSGIDGVEVSDFEFRLPRPSFTYNTLSALAANYKDDKFKLIIGSDNWNIFERWRNAGQIISEFGIMVYPRPGYADPVSTSPNVEFLADAPLTDISSSTIRHMISMDQDISGYLPPKVASFIESTGLYKGKHIKTDI